MTKTNNKNALGAALIGAALLARFLSRSGSDATPPGAGAASREPDDAHRTSAHPSAAPVARRRVVVWVRADDRIDVDGMPVDLATAVAHAQRAGSAQLHATGDAVWEGTLDLIRALIDAGVDLDIWEDVDPRWAVTETGHAQR